MLIADAPDMQIADVSGFSWRTIGKHSSSSSSSISSNGAQTVVCTFDKWHTSVSAAIKGSSSPAFEDKFKRSHPVAISELGMHVVVQSCHQSASCVQSGTGVTERAPQIGFWLWTPLVPVVSDDWPVCVWSLLWSVVIVLGLSVGRLFDVIREADLLTTEDSWVSLDSGIRIAAGFMVVHLTIIPGFNKTDYGFTTKWWNSLSVYSEIPVRYKLIFDNRQFWISNRLKRTEHMMVTVETRLTDLNKFWNNSNIVLMLQSMLLLLYIFVATEWLLFLGFNHSPPFFVRQRRPHFQTEVNALNNTYARGCRCDVRLLHRQLRSILQKPTLKCDQKRQL